MSIGAQQGSAFPRDRDSDFEEGAGTHDRAGAGAYAGRVSGRAGGTTSSAKTPPQSQLSSSAKADDPVFQRRL